MRRLLVTVFAFAAPLTAHAQSACRTGTFAEYVALGSTGCTVDGVTFQNARLNGLRSDRAIFDPFVEKLGDGRRLVGFDVVYTIPVSSPSLLPIGPRDQDLLEGVFDITVNGAGLLVGAQITDVIMAVNGGTLPRPWDQLADAGLQSIGASGFLPLARVLLRGQCGVSSNLCRDVREVEFAPQATLQGGIFAYVSGGDRDPAAFGASSSVSRLRGGWVVAANASTVPEPGTWALLGTGLIGLGAVARRRRAA